jgi:hypothetical protein
MQWGLLMLAFLSRVWAGIVGAVAGACLGFLVCILLFSVGAALNVALWAVAVLAAVGAVAGFAFGNRKLGGK